MMVSKNATEKIKLKYEWLEKESYVEVDPKIYGKSAMNVFDLALLLLKEFYGETVSYCYHYDLGKFSIHTCSGSWKTLKLSSSKYYGIWQLLIENNLIEEVEG